MDIRNAGHGPRDDAYDISDPTDWLGTPLASLMPVEQALRCHVCKDFYSSPMVTSCCHTFCSLCIRRALASDGKCPLCRATDQESRLRGNWAIREAVESFMKGRDTMLSVARQPLPSAQTSSTGATAQTPKRKAGGSTQDSGHNSKRTRMSTRSSSARSAETTSAMIREEAQEQEVEEIEIDEYMSNDGLVACPICSWRMKPEKVDRHLDTDCPGEPRPQPSHSQSKPKNLGFPSTRPAANILAKPQERLSPLNYSMVKDTALRKRLQEIGISNWGPRHLLEKRHREWVTIWNANCDSARPKSKAELLRDLDTWERTQGGSAPSNSHSANLGAQIKDKEFDGQGWASKHSDSFKDLIANARKSRQKAGGMTQESSHEVRDQPSDAGNLTPEQQPDGMNNGQQHAEGYAIRSSNTMKGQSIASNQVAADQSPRVLADDRLAGPVPEDRPLSSQTNISSS